MSDDKELQAEQPPCNQSELIEPLGAKYSLPKPPKLEDIRSRPCTLEELQAAFVNLVDLYNEQGKRMEAAINRKQDREWRATL